MSTASYHQKGQGHAHRPPSTSRLRATHLAFERVSGARTRGPLEHRASPMKAAKSFAMLGFRPMLQPAPIAVTRAGSRAVQLIPPLFDPVRRSASKLNPSAPIDPLDLGAHREFQLHSAPPTGRSTNSYRAIAPMYWVFQPSFSGSSQRSVRQPLSAFDTRLNAPTVARSPRSP